MGLTDTVVEVRRSPGAVARPIVIALFPTLLAGAELGQGRVVGTLAALALVLLGPALVLTVAQLVARRGALLRLDAEGIRLQGCAAVPWSDIAAVGTRHPVGPRSPHAGGRAVVFHPRPGVRLPAPPPHWYDVIPALTIPARNPNRAGVLTVRTSGTTHTAHDLAAAAHHLDENLAAGALHLTEHDMAALTAETDLSAR